MTSESKQLRLLIVAEACNPAWSSVPLVGYNMATSLARRPELDVTVVSHIRNREDVLKSELALRANLVFIDNELVAKPMFKIGQLLRGGSSLGWTTNMALNWPGYIYFEKKVLRLFREHFRQGKFDLIHRLTPLSPTIGSPLATNSNVPMLLGPLNGGLPWPADYPELRGKEREWLVPIRNAYKALPYYWSMYRSLAGVIAGSRHTATETPEQFSGREFYIPENGIDPKKFELAAGWTAPEPGKRFRFITVGRLVPYKATDMTLEAMRDSESLRQTELRIIGDGPFRGELERRVKEFGLEENVTFLGWMDQKEVGKELSSAQAFAFPSLREFGGGVVLEAMASGLPSIIVDYGGPAELVTKETGIAIPMQPREGLIGDLRTAMETLAADHNRCRTLAGNSVKEVRTKFTWDAKAGQMLDFYEKLVPGGFDRTAGQSAEIDAAFAEIDGALCEEVAVNP